MASSSPTHPNYSPLFIKPPSPVNEPELAELWAQMDKYIANGYQDTSSDKEDEELSTDEKWPTIAEEGGPATEEKLPLAAEEERTRVVEEVKSHTAEGEEEHGAAAGKDDEDKPTIDNDDEKEKPK